jgi:hypothetical protein
VSDCSRVLFSTWAITVSLLRNFSLMWTANMTSSPSVIPSPKKFLSFVNGSGQKAG